MIDAIREHSKEPTTLRVIRLVLFGRAAATRLSQWRPISSAPEYC